MTGGVAVGVGGRVGVLSVCLVSMCKGHCTVQLMGGVQCGKAGCKRAVETACSLRR